MGMIISISINMIHREIRARTTEKPASQSQNHTETTARTAEKLEPDPQRNQSQNHTETRATRSTEKPESERSETRVRSAEKPEPELHRKWRFCPQICGNECLYQPIRSMD